MSHPTRRRTRAGLSTVLAAVAALSLVGCAAATSGGGDPVPSTTTATAPAPTPSENPYGDGIAVDPPAAGEPVLVVSGGDDVTRLSMRQLERLGTTTVSVAEPFVKQRQSFTGVPLAAVLDRAGIPASVAIETIALNDYRYTAAAGDLLGSDALVATARNGEPIPMDQGGPIRLIFPDGTAKATDLDAWNWSLAEIRVA
jgi:hypothetical protein